MKRKYVIGLDSSTQSTKAIAWDKEGLIVATGRSAIPMDNPGFDRYEQNPPDWWESARIALKECMDALPAASDIEGLAISNQRETIAFLDKDGRAVSPAIVWLDERARDEVATLNNALGENVIHSITGRPPDVTPCVYKLSWMQKNAADVCKKTACFADVQSYLVQRLCGGKYRTGWISSDPMGMYDLQQKCWSKPILDLLEITENQLPEACAPGEQLGLVTAEAARYTGLPEGLPVFAAGGDGQCAGLGTNCTVPDRAYINLGTAVVSGIWSPDYRYNSAWRTELAAQGNGYIFENCLRSGAFLLNWFVEQFGLVGSGDDAASDDAAGDDVWEQLESEAARLPIGSQGLMVQPYWSGVMDPYWDPLARGVIVGLSGSHTRAHIYRAILEGITLDQVMATFDMEAAADQEITHYVAIGGGAKSRLWRQMLADASGKPVLISPTIEASALGAGMIAAFGAGWYESIEDAAAGMSHIAETVTPDATNAKRYHELLSIYRDMYQANASINQRLVSFSESSSTA